MRSRLYTLPAGLLLFAATAPSEAQVLQPNPFGGRVLLPQNRTAFIPTGPNNQVVTEEEARKLIANIDEGSNAMTLQYRLFGGRRPGSVPAEKVMEIINEQLKQETKGSPRWAQLQFLRAQGGFSVLGFNDDGNDAYLALFTTPLPAEAQPVLLSALQKYLTAVGGTRPPMMIRNQMANQIMNWRPAMYSSMATETLSTPQVFRAALNVYLSLQPSRITGEMPWLEAAKIMEMVPDVARLLDERLAKPDTTEAQRLSLLPLTIQFYEGIDEKRAWELLEAAGPLANKAGESNYAFNETRINLLMKRERHAEAAAIKWEMVKKTGSGYGALAEMLLESKNTAELKNLIDAMKAPNSTTSAIYEVLQVVNKRREIPGLDRNSVVIELATAFLQPQRGKILPDREKLATAFLRTEGNRAPDQEIQVRLILARQLYWANQRQAAVILLRDTPVPRVMGRAANHQYWELQDVLERMAAGTYCDA